MPTATVTSKGQITIPKEIRDFLHLKKGQELDFKIADDGRVILRALDSDVRRLKGIIKPPPGTHATIEEINRTIADAYAGLNARRR